MSEPARVNDWIISQHVRAGHTRDCFFPWDTVFIHADRTVRVCCTSAIVAKVEPDWDLEALMNGPELVEFRRNFIAGVLTHECHICTIRTEIPLEEFRGKLTDYLTERGNGRRLKRWYRRCRALFGSRNPLARST